MGDLMLQYHALSHPNHPSPRALNEDAFLAVSGVRQGRLSLQGEVSAEEPRLFAISDGVHTSPQPARASRTLLSCLERIWAADPDLPPGKKLHQLQSDFTDSVAGHPERIGMSCTLVAAEIRGHHGTIYHVGDSRAWIIRDGIPTRLTSDHTQLESLIRSGDIPREDAHKYASIYGALENYFVATPDEERPHVDYCTVSLKPGDAVLLASDGLPALADTRVTKDACTTLATIAEDLFYTALDEGIEDNITLLIITSKTRKQH